MRLVTVVLSVLLVLIQYPLWWGHGGWLRVHDLQQQMVLQQKKNAEAKVRNERVEGEVRDLQNGTAAVEERARYEMGMIKDSEVFVQFVSPATSAPVPAALMSSTSTRGQVSAEPVRVVPNPESRAVRAEKKRAVKKEAKAKHAG
ncbi:cell division protein FtsB [Paraburkholderia bonniea]|uniref:cell division protein FtsB n=1 Tax=Paraburkholderia bonniea TaxID=2152891 RepID=UPI001292B295|nr:cell division protein FtsB [Paraburkholderia bonniea]WJF91183.1 cell division protein FtsB [Paraburkholderia bonniea]WJF94498.1 cell division protein FtsB [Paraburkholderia bonniea]